MESVAATSSQASIFSFAIQTISIYNGVRGAFLSMARVEGRCGAMYKERALKRSRKNRKPTGSGFDMAASASLIGPRFYKR